MYLGATDPKVKARQQMEQRIITQLVDELLEHSFLLNVDDGDGLVLPTASADRKAILDALMNTDQDFLYAYKKEGGGWVRLVYGNDGYDVISDYTTKLEPFMVKTQALADKLAAAA
jgi:hypothetical protein